MSFSSLFKSSKRKHHPIEENNIAVIGAPTNVNHDIHVTVNNEGLLLGLPSAWVRQIGTQITEDEQSKNPLVVKQVLQYYNYSIKKGNQDGQEFKHIVTERDIVEESKEIDNFSHSKDAHKSKDSILSEHPEETDIDRKTYPVRPRRKLDATNLVQTKNLAQNLEDLSLASEPKEDVELRNKSDSDLSDDDFMRRRSGLTDDDYMKAIKAICNPGDPYVPPNDRLEILTDETVRQSE